MPPAGAWGPRAPPPARFGPPAPRAAAPRGRPGAAPGRGTIRDAGEVVLVHVLDTRGGGEAVAGEPDAPAAQVAADLLVLDGVKAVLGQQRFQRTGGPGLVGGDGQHAFQQRGQGGGEVVPSLGGVGELLQVAALAAGEVARLASQERRDRLAVITDGQQGAGAGQQGGGRTVFVDREVVDDRIHRKGQRGLEVPLCLEHDFLQAGLRGGAA